MLILSSIWLRTSLAIISLIEAFMGVRSAIKNYFDSFGASLKSTERCSVLLTGFSMDQHLNFDCEFGAGVALSFEGT